MAMMMQLKLRMSSKIEEYTKNKRNWVDVRREVMGTHVKYNSIISPYILVLEHTALY